MTHMKMSDQGIQFLKDEESFENTAYRDQAGHLTIGVGHLLTQSELKTGVIELSGGRRLQWKHGLSDEEVDALLRDDLVRREKVLSDWAEGYLYQHQFDAALSLLFNIGTTAFANSTVLRRIKQGRFDEVPAAMKLWNKVTDPNTGNKVVSRGLKRRRDNEANLWTNGYPQYAQHELPSDPVMLERSIEYVPPGTPGASEHLTVPRESYPQPARKSSPQRLPWYMRMLRSKINWVAGMGLMTLNTLVFGGNLTPEQIESLTPLITSGLLGAVMFLRTFFNKPE